MESGLAQAKGEMTAGNKIESAWLNWAMVVFLVLILLIAVSLIGKGFLLASNGKAHATGGSGDDGDFVSNFFMVLMFRCVCSILFWNDRSVLAYVYWNGCSRKRF